jgi:two-component system, cell cycle response regulator DivK
MSQGCSYTEPIARAREGALTLVDESRAWQAEIQALAAAASRDMEAAKAELGRALDVSMSPIGEVRSVLRDHLQRSIASVRAARRVLRGARRQHAAAAQLLSGLDSVAAVDDGAIRPETVLVVDDHDDLRVVIQQILEAAGFVVSTAANGLEALVVAHQMRPAVVLMDVTMPILDGLEATRLLKAAAATRHARVIAYTGDPVVASAAGNSMFVAVLEKPALPELVVQTVREAASL